jgi:para-nitrobenzyl esterase
MSFQSSRRDFIVQSSLVATLSTGFMRSSWAQTSANAPLGSPRRGAVEAETAYGRVRGAETRGIKSFKGIPYAASTAGKNRFMPPLKPAAWTGVRDALDYGARAPQAQPRPRGEADEQGATPGQQESEDCLLLNVWTPGLADGGKRPVIMWCHGGGFNTGSGAAPVNDGTNLALRGDIVTVTTNHRLNVLGFTYLGEIGGKDFEQSAALGVLDLVAALEWIRDNIERFGGDPGNVTIIGQSGGAQKVSTLLTMPSAKGLFHRAVVMSGSALQLLERDAAARVTRELVAELGLSKPTIAQLQAVPIDRLMGAYFATVAKLNTQRLGQGFRPAVDGTAITQHPFHPTASRVSPDVPVIFSHTSGEATFRADERLFTLDEAGMRDELRNRTGDKTDALVGLYRKLYPQATPPDLYFLIASDHQYGGGATKAAERRSAPGFAPAYLYYWTWESPLEGGKYRAQHTIDIAFAFDNVQASRLTAGAPDAQALADQVSEAFIAFFRSGDPNTPKSKLPTWPRYDATNRPTMVFSSTPALRNDPIREQRVAMWDVLGLAG